MNTMNARLAHIRANPADLSVWDDWHDEQFSREAVPLRWQSDRSAVELKNYLVVEALWKELKLRGFEPIEAELWEMLKWIKEKQSCMFSDSRNVLDAVEHFGYAF